jgi:hypothetical protein
MCIRDKLIERPDIQPGFWSFFHPALATDLFICSSIKDAIAWLEFDQVFYRSLNTLCFFAVGNLPEKFHAEIIRQYTPKKKLHFLFSKDDLGALCDLKLASYIRNKPIQVSYHDHRYLIHFENKHYQFDRLSLNALEKASGYNFKIRTHKPKNAPTYHEQTFNRHPA